MRWPGLGRKAGIAPYLAIAVGVVSGNYIFAEPLKQYFEARPELTRGGGANTGGQKTPAVAAATAAATAATGPKK